MLPIRCFPRVSFLVLSALLLLLVSAEAALPTDKVAYTVSGISGKIDNIDGYPGVSVLDNPGALCPSLSQPSTVSAGYPVETLLVGASNAFRNLSVSTWETGTWINNAPSSTTSTTGSVDSVSLVNPAGCATNLTSSAMYYVESNRYVYSVVDDVVSVYSVCTGCTFVDVDMYDGKVYLLNLNLQLYVCTLGTDYRISSCTRQTLTGLTPNSIQKVGLAVSSEGIFVATGVSLAYFSFDGTALATTTSVHAVDVHFMLSNSSQLIAASERGIFSVEWTSSSLTPTLLAGSSSTATVTCSSTTDYNGESPSFCSVYRIYPISFANIYMTNADLSVVRLLRYPNEKVNVTLTVPFPEGMDGSAANMTEIYDAINEALKDALGTDYVDLIEVNRSAVTVSNETFETTLVIELPQQSNTSSIINAIENTDYTTALDLVEVYYNATDENVYSDNFLIDGCNATAELVARQTAAVLAQEALDYSLVYSGEPNQFGSTTSPNSLFLKWLMPATFGGSNTTTHELLESIDYNEALVTAYKKSYAASMQADVSFPESTYHLNQMGAKNQRQVRAKIRTILISRFASCASSVSTTSSTCQSQVSISNRTLVSGTELGTSSSQYSIFVPDIYTGLDVEQCVKDTDWSSLEKWLKNLNKSTTCGTGCIVGIAIAAAFVVILLLILLIVCLSKRRRLAAAVAPDPIAKPGFVSAVDLDATDDDQSFVNPLA